MDRSSGEIFEKRCIGRYVIEETVSLNRYSSVFRAYDPNLQRPVSLKLYHGRAEADVQRILTEGRALSRVESPFVARCYSLEEFEGTPVLVNEWIEGVTLEQYMLSLIHI